jgi:hypothetical protein
VADDAGPEPEAGIYSGRASVEDGLNAPQGKLENWKATL